MLHMKSVLVTIVAAKTKYCYEKLIISQQIISVRSTGNVIAVRGGATVLKVGGDNFASGASKKIFFDPPTFWPVGGTKYCLDS